MALAEKILQCLQISRAKSPAISLSLDEVDEEPPGCFTATTKRRKIVSSIYPARNLYASVAGQLLLAAVGPQLLKGAIRILPNFQGSHL